MNRLTGIVTFKAPVYREVAEDTTATQSAALIVIVVAVIVGIVNGVLSRSFIGTLLVVVITQLIGWGLGSWVLAFVAKQFFQGDTNTSEMLRVTGYTSVFRIIGVIPFLGIVGAILQIVANIIGIREAAGFDTTKAILTAIISGIIVFIVTLIIGFILAAIGLGAAAVTGSLNR
ncbi:MAG: YIP1 family protein [Chloroflexi bacterium]|nr:YIP1 family protein [Chloroflexota bacterium]